MDKTHPEWRKLAFAFFSIAHNDFKDFDALSFELRDTEVGRLLEEYRLTRDQALVEKAGKLLTGTRQWYVYLGRMM